MWGEQAEAQNRFGEHVTRREGTGALTSPVLSRLYIDSKAYSRKAVRVNYIKHVPNRTGDGDVPTHIICKA